MSPAPVIIIPTAVIAKRNAIIRRFDKAAAHSPETAQTLESLSITRGHIFDRMVRSGLIMEGESGRFWLDQTAHAAFQRRVLRNIAIALGVACVAIIAMVLFTR